jgi:hypothetical protein
MDLALPYTPGLKAAYDRVREAAPDLWGALEEDVLPAARGDEPPADRARTVLDRRDALWDDYRDRDPRGAVALGRSWQEATDDVVGALVTADLPADRGALEDLMALVEERMDDSYTGLTLKLALRTALGD